LRDPKLKTNFIAIEAPDFKQYGEIKLNKDLPKGYLTCRTLCIEVKYSLVKNEFEFFFDEINSSKTKPNVLIYRWIQLSLSCLYGPD